MFLRPGEVDGSTGELVSLAVNTGADGDPNPQMLLALVEPTAGAGTALVPQHPMTRSFHIRFSDLAAVAPQTTRQLYFSEDLSDQKDPKFYIMVKGQKPKGFTPMILRPS